MKFNPDKPYNEMHRVKEKMGVYQRERIAPMHTCLEVHKKMQNLGMSVGECTGIVHTALDTHKKSKHFLGIWEEIYNPDFNSPEFEVIKNQAGLNRFVLSVKQWVAKTNSKGIIAKINYRIHTDAIRENLNAVFINDGLEQAERLTRLNPIAIHQMRILAEDRKTRKLVGMNRNE